MPDPTEEQREHPSTYTVQDRSNIEEMTRLEIQDTMLTKGQGGVLPELTEHSHLRRVLDVGCGTGGWLRETAKTYPTIKKLVGVDISTKMVAYAQEKTIAQHLEGRIQFQTADALRALPFSNGYFDLVNQRAAFTWLRTWDWKKILIECQRVCRPGGILQITEVDVWSGGNSPALSKLCDIGLEAFHHSGRLFTFSRDGVTSHLVPLLIQHGFEDVKHQVHPLVYRAGEAEHDSFYQDMLHAFRVALPFLQKWTNVPSDYQQIYEQALKEMQQPDFVATWRLVTAWGTRHHGAPMLMRGLQ